MIVLQNMAALKTHFSTSFEIFLKALWPVLSMARKLASITKGQIWNRSRASLSLRLWIWYILGSHFMGNLNSFTHFTIDLSSLRRRRLYDYNNNILLILHVLYINSIGQVNFSKDMYYLRKTVLLVVIWLFFFYCIICFLSKVVWPNLKCYK